MSSIAVGGADCGADSVERTFEAFALVSIRIVAGRDACNAAAGVAGCCC